MRGLGRYLSVLGRMDQLQLAASVCARMPSSLAVHHWFRLLVSGPLE